MSWIKVSSYLEPPKNRPLLCYCPEWNSMGYDLAYWSKDKGFHSDHISDDSPFNELVEKWCIFKETD